MSPPERGSRWSGRRTRDTLTNSRRPALTQDHFAETVVVRAGRHDHSRNSLRDLFVARDRSWFSDDYVPFRTSICNWNDLRFEAIGIGTVIIPVDLEDGERGEFQLRNVLHYPDAVCNIVGKPAIEAYGLGYIRGAASRLLVMASNDVPVAYFEREDGRPFRTLILSGPPHGARLGPCSLDEEGSSMLEMHWPESERERFKVFQDKALDTLSELERAWLKENWGGEFKFLIAYGLSIYDDEKCKEGREIMRMMMAKEKESKRVG